jgi:putative FmdB family regulatory protein
MPLYEYYCPTCEQKFELLRPMTRSNDPAVCAQGHRAKRVLSPFSSFTKGADGSMAPVGGGSPCSSCAADSCSTCPVT